MVFRISSNYETKIWIMIFFPKNSNGKITGNPL
jgi:hypothetical protein